VPLQKFSFYNTPQKFSTWHPLRNSEFQTPSENLVNRGVWILNGMAQYCAV
jgi:hypothetical protein